MSVILRVEYDGAVCDVLDDDIERAAGLRVEAGGYLMQEQVRDMQFIVDTPERAEWLADKLRRKFGVRAIVSGE